MARDATPGSGGSGGAPPCVRELQEGEGPAWDDYVAAHPRATFFHRFAWRAVLGALGHRVIHLVAERRGAIRGVLPLGAARDLRLARGLYSLPHTVYGGPLGDDGESEAALLAAARQLARRLGARRLELRNRHPTTLDLPRHFGFVTCERPLPARASDLPASFNPGARAALAQARRAGLDIDFAAGVEEFHPLLAATYRRLGTPLFPRGFVAAIRAAFPDDSEIAVVRRAGRPVAAALTLRWRDAVMPLFSAETMSGRAVRADNFKYLRLMERAIDRGATRFDFGRSRRTNPGAIAFKRHLGGEVIELPYQVDGVAATADPNGYVYRQLRRLWRRLPPAAGERLGPVLLRRFP